MDPIEYICRGLSVPSEDQIISFYYNFESQNPKIIAELDIQSRPIKVKNYYSQIANLSAIRFVSPLGLVLANIDAVFNIVRTMASYLQPTDLTDFKFASIGGSGGGEVQYLQYRRPNCQGWGLTQVGGFWDKGMINMDRFNPQYGTGDNDRSNYNYLRESVIGRFYKGVDFVFVNTKDLIFGLGLAIGVLSHKGNMVAKVDPLKDADYIFLVSLCFERITLFKPLVSDDIYLLAFEKIEVKNPFDTLLFNSREIKKTSQFMDWITPLIEFFYSPRDQNMEKLSMDYHAAIITFKIPMIGDKI